MTNEFYIPGSGWQRVNGFPVFPFLHEQIGL